MASIPITGRDAKSYEINAATSGVASLATPYSNPAKVDRAPGSTAGPFEGNESLFNRYYTFYYSGPLGDADGTIGANLF